KWLLGNASVRECGSQPDAPPRRPGHPPGASERLGGHPVRPTGFLGAMPGRPAVRAVSGRDGRNGNARGGRTTAVAPGHPVLATAWPRDTSSKRCPPRVMAAARGGAGRTGATGPSTPPGLPQAAGTQPGVGPLSPDPATRPPRPSARRIIGTLLYPHGEGRAGHRYGG